MATLEELRTLLNTIPSGPISSDSRSLILERLAAAWDDLSGSGAHGMAGDKVLREKRAEQLTWNSPILSFRIERHGSTVQGSTRAEVQEWNIDVHRGVAAVALVGIRQLRPRAGNLDIRGLAQELAAAIAERHDDPRLRWRLGDSVELLTAVAIPQTNPQTTQSRRQRLVAALKAMLASDGWELRRSGSHTLFERSEA